MLVAHRASPTTLTSVLVVRDEPRCAMRLDQYLSQKRAPRGFVTLLKPARREPCAAGADTRMESKA